MSPTLWSISIHCGLNVQGMNSLVLAQVGRQLDHTLLAEIPREGIAGTRTKTCWMTHDVGGLWLSMGELEIVSLVEVVQPSIFEGLG